MAISKIVVATDFSDCADRAVAEAIELAKERGATIEIVHAFVSPLPAVYRLEDAMPADYEREARKSAKAMLTAEADKAHAAGLQVRTHLVETPAAGAIARIADEVGADLVVVGTRGQTGLKHILMGSVAEHTTRMTTCSVLVVK